MMSEEGVIRALERTFPGSDWIEEAPATIKKFKALKGRPLPASTPPAALPVEGSPSGGGEAVDYVVIGGGPNIEGGKPTKKKNRDTGEIIHGVTKERLSYDEKALKKWFNKLGPVTIMTTMGAGAEAQLHELGSERVLGSGRAGPRVVGPPLRSAETYGSSHKKVTVEAALCAALGDGTIVLVGKGARVTQARDWIKRLTEHKTYGSDRVTFRTHPPFQVIELP